MPEPDPYVTGWFHAIRSVPAHFFDAGRPLCQDSDPGVVIVHAPDEEAIGRLCEDCKAIVKGRIAGELFTRRAEIVPAGRGSSTRTQSVTE